MSPVPTYRCLIFLLVLWPGFSEPADNLSGILRRYETLHRNDLRGGVIKRDIQAAQVRELSFHTLGRDFRIHLEKDLRVLTPGFRVFAIDAESNARRVDVDVTNIYRGYVIGEHSTVQAYFEEGEDGEDDLSAKIQTKDELYIIEPSWRHLPTSNNHSMIAYRGSDVNIEEDFGTKYCGHVRADGTDDAAYDSVDHSIEDLILDGHSHSESGSERYKRQLKSSYSYTPDKDTCAMLLVADYKFFESMGQKSLSRTTSYLISLIDRVNHIYRHTRWGNGFHGVGIGIKEIHIHEAPTPASTHGELHYNTNINWDTKELLEYFSRESRYKDFCLAHLFTHQAFEGGVLGLAYIAAPRDHSVGGICSQDYYKNGAQLFLNTGWSSSLNSYKRRLLTQEADLVTTHEIGHNWGSEHDPSTAECAPSSFNGGKYVMYTYSVSGYDPNNKIFSDCSRRSIGAVLDVKYSKCFSQPIKAYCGNAQVEEDEECDPGAMGEGVEDQCCDKYTCTLKPKAICSDTNDLCCEQCTFAARNVACHVAQEGSCEDSAYCTGTEKTCPDPPHKNNGSTCIGKGKCDNGVCVPFCETRGKMSCACDQTLDDSCKWCCRDNRTSMCVPYDDGTGVENLPEGMPCLKGFCTELGICEESVQDLVQRIWDIIEQLGPNKIVAFMRANIVGTVIILSLFIWVPASCIVCHIDRKNRQREFDEIDWLRYDNPKLVAQNELNNVRAVPGMKKRLRRNDGNVYKPTTQL